MRFRVGFLLKAILACVLVGTLVLSLAINVAFFVGGSLYSIANSAFETATGLRSLASRQTSEIAQLTGELQHERHLKRRAMTEASESAADLAAEKRLTKGLRRDLAENSAKLASEKQVSDKLRRRTMILTSDLQKANKKLTDPSRMLIRYRGRKMSVSQAVDATANRISSRAKKTASREVGAMYGESIPWLGTFVIVAATTWELKDLCDTLKDMDDLKRSFSIDEEPDDQPTTVCTMEIPTREEIWTTAKSSPKNAWSTASNAMPSLSEIKEIAKVDWSRIGDTIGGFASGAYEGSSGLLSEGYDATVSFGKSTWDGFFVDDADRALDEN